jgi:hypothetical protein
MLTRWFEGPLLPLPDSQRSEDYPKDMAGAIRIASDAALGTRYWRLWTSQGVTPALRFVVGDLPEVIEEEIDGDPVPAPVKLPVTINGRIFPRENVDVWTFYAVKGQAVWCEVHAARLGSPLDARLEVLNALGKVIAENDDAGGPDPRLRFVPPADGLYHVRIRDTQNQGGPAYIYRLTLTAGPHVDHFYPLGGKRGGQVNLEVVGQGVPRSPVAIALPDSPEPEYRHRLPISGERTNEMVLQLDDLPEHLEGEAGTAGPLAVPAVFNGRISKSGEVDAWLWLGRKGQTYELELRAAQLGSRLDGVFSISDAAGKELARAETAGPLDPKLRFTAPADGTYVARVQDRFRSRGGPAYAYRLRIDQPGAPDFRLWLGADAVTVPRNGQARVKIRADRLAGFKEPIQIKVEGIPPGVNVTGTTITAGQNSCDLTFKAEASAKAEPARLIVTGVAQAAEREIARRAVVPAAHGQPVLDELMLVAAVPTPFVVKGDYDMGFAARGTIHKRKYKIERNGFDGPIEISLADRQARHLQGVTGPTIVVPAGANEFTYSASLPSWMETGRTCRVCVMAIAVVKDKDGTEHRVSFSSVNQNEQLVAVVGPGKLALELGQASLIARPGQVVRVPVRIKRAPDLRGEATVELILPAHMKGVSADSSAIAADSEQGELTIHFAGTMIGPFNMPVTVRATVMHRGEPHVAEAKLDIQP